jgi:hypothetical protein
VSYSTAGVDAVLFISRDAAEPDVNCDAGADAAVDGTEDLLFTAPVSGNYYLVVDNYNAGGGAFSLDLTF